MCYLIRAFKVENLHYLKGFSNYGFTSDGKIYSHISKKWIGDKEAGDYVKLSLKNDDGEIIVTSRHRCIATLFVDKKSEENIIVNHLNGIPGDDKPGNLEWTTYQGNQEHAGMMGLTEKCLPVSVRNPNTGEIRHYPSATAAGKDIGISKDNILWRINNSEEKIYPEGFQYRRRDDSKPWPLTLTTQYGRSVPVLLRDVVTGEIREFTKQSDLAESIGSCLASINLSANDINQPLIQNRYQVKLKTDIKPWREVKDIYHEHGLKQPVIVISELTGEETIYPSAKACADAIGIKTTTLNERLKFNGSKAIKGFRFKRY